MLRRSLIGKHLRDIRKGGLEILWRKVLRITKCFTDVVGALAVVPVVIICRLLKPWCLIRFGFFTVDRIGHFSFDVEYHLSERAISEKNIKSIDLLFFKGVPANSQMARMCRRLIVVSPVVQKLYLANKYLPGGSAHENPPARHRLASRDKTGIFYKTPVQLAFTSDENRTGTEYLRKVGCEDDTKYICLIVRDSAYLESTQPERDWSYHDYRDTSIEDYEDAALALVGKGYWVFRMGKAVNKAFLPNQSRVIDYATLGDRCDFLDIWLMANCHFAISTGLGLDSIADIFRRPLVFVNYLPLMDMEAWGPFITVPKVLSWSANGQPLTLLEQVQHTSVNTQYYENNGIDIEDLSPIDIKNAVMEMEARLNGNWIGTQEDEVLNRRFWDTLRLCQEFSQYHGWVHPKARVGTHYLRHTENWLLPELPNA